jgi:TAZ zinc finger
MTIDNSDVSSLVVLVPSKEDMDDNDASSMAVLVPSIDDNHYIQSDIDTNHYLKVRHKQQRLLLLHHSAKCQYESNCPVTKHCTEMKILWQHMATCNDMACRFSHCYSSRAILSHFRKCTDINCRPCTPVRRDVVQRIISETSKSTEVSTAAASPSCSIPSGGTQPMKHNIEIISNTTVEPVSSITDDSASSTYMREAKRFKSEPKAVESTDPSNRVVSYFGMEPMLLAPTETNLPTKHEACDLVSYASSTTPPSIYVSPDIVQPIVHSNKTLSDVTGLPVGFRSVEIGSKIHCREVNGSISDRPVESSRCTVSCFENLLGTLNIELETYDAELGHLKWRLWLSTLLSKRNFLLLFSIISFLPLGGRTKLLVAVFVLFRMIIPKKER